ncbi:ABC transporter ATP-binding protein, partial [Streptomyces sp. NPDC003832]
GHLHHRLLEIGHSHSRAVLITGKLSGGQQQRVAIARALAIDPEIVLMDEPLSNLDAALRIEMRTEIKRLYQERGLTVLYVTHDQEEALSLATRLVVLRKGVLEQTGTPQEVYTNPASAYVAGFMGYRNLFTATVESTGPGDDIAVLAHGTVLHGTRRAVRDAAVGSTVSVAVRPEDLVVGTGATGNSIRATAEVVEYHGRELSVRARTAQGALLHLKTNEPVVAGAVLELGVRPDRVLVYPVEGDEETARNHG